MSIKLQNIKQGDHFWECEAGMNMHFIAECDAWQVDNGWWVLGKDDDGNIVRFFDGGNGYGPKLYNEAIYGYSKR